MKIDFSNKKQTLWIYFTKYGCFVFSILTEMFFLFGIDDPKFQNLIVFC